jgi:uncharacterized protein
MPFVPKSRTIEPRPRADVPAYKSQRFIAGAPSGAVDPPRFLADEMVGRLARYLRFVGCDTVYVKGMDDAEIADLARAEGRILLTRDRELAHRTPSALLLKSPGLSDQWLAVHTAFPGLSSEVRFERCTECNGPLLRYSPDPSDPRPEGVPWDRIAQGLPLFRCTGCAHLYWEGSHTARIREQIHAWSGGSSP